MRLPGYVGLDGYETAVGEVSYWTVAGFRNRGFATTALRVFSPWASKTFGLSVLEANVDPRNPASSRAAERAGYVASGWMHGPGSSGDPVGLRYIYVGAD
jgi:RimJ/RimL family protein N-acetyltransferase